MRSIEKSKQAFKEASNYFPGGVNSPVRAFKNVGGDPLFIKKKALVHIFMTLMVMNTSTTFCRGDHLFWAMLILK